jgi:enoyl-CoA hydratase
MAYDTIIADCKGPVAIITLNRPKAMNALSQTMIAEIGRALDFFQDDEDIGAIVITGNDKAFAAGADIKEMASKTFTQVYLENFITKGWEAVSQVRKPVIAAVAGYCLGAGCETAMMCDIILAADTAKFGQPEITIGVIPGAGGTQRLPRAVGKAKAMEMVLTGRMMDAAEAERCGLVSRVVPAADLLDEAIKVGGRIASMGRASVYAAKEAVNVAYESTLSEGIRFERRMFHALFATEDQKEGMAAFAEKRQPTFKNR